METAPLRVIPPLKVFDEVKVFDDDVIAILAGTVGIIGKLVNVVPFNVKRVVLIDVLFIFSISGIEVYVVPFNVIDGHVRDVEKVFPPYTSMY
jgi:hypothetical protein